MDAVAFERGGDAFKKSFMDYHLAPILDAMKEMKATQDATITAADQAKAAAEAKAAGDVLVNATRAEERERFAVLTDAMPSDCRRQAGGAHGG